MSSDIGKYVPLKTIVSYYIDQEKKSIGDFDSCWLMAMRALVDIGFDMSFEPLTVRLPVNGNMTAQLPPDYLSWTKIGVMNSSGEVNSLKINNSLTKFRDNNPNRLSQLTPDTIDQDFNNIVQNPYFLNYYFGGWYTPLFGLGNGLLQFGECSVDERNGVIVLNTNFPFSDVLLEYISSPQRNGDYQIETVCQEAVIAFIAWKMKTGNDQDYYFRKAEARRRLNPVRLSVINQALRENAGFKIKA
jgi:hypothetical protein